MSKSFKRSDRVSSELQKQLSIILQRECNTKIFGMISLNQLEISPDLIYVKAFVTFLDVGESEQYSNAQKIAKLNEQVPYIRSLLAKKVLLRVVPELKFIYDDSGEKYDHINRILQTVKK